MTIFWIIILFVVIGLVYKYQKDRKRQTVTAENQTEPTKKKSHKSLLITAGIIILFGILINSSLNSAREKAKLVMEKEKEDTATEQQLPQEQTQPEQIPQSPQEAQKEQEEKTGLSDKEAMAVMEIVLTGYGLYDIDMKIADGRDKGGVRVLILSYKSIASTLTKLAGESGFILGSYTAGVENGWDIDELSVVVGDIQGNAVGMWYCSKEWTDDFVAGKISAEELDTKVLTTMTTF